MRKIKLYIAISLNGKIAKSDGSVEWLENMPNPEKISYGFDELYQSIDTTLQGYKTYELILNRGIEIPSTDKRNLVLTGKQDIENTQYIEFIKKDHVDFIRQLKKEKGKDIWLIGGGKTNTLLFNENLIDEMQVFVMPVIIPGGINLFEHIPKEKMLHLIETKTYSTGAVELKYAID